MNKCKIFLICPVRNATAEQKELMVKYIANLEDLGNSVYYPDRDNPHETSDPIGYEICKENLRAIKDSEEVHVFWDNQSRGSLFDLGAAFSLNKKLVIANPDSLIITEGKSFTNMIAEWCSKK